MFIDIVYRVREIRPESLKNTQAIVIDVFRATSTIVTALAHGAKAIIPASSPQDALDHKKINPQARLGGEIKCRKIEGFDFGNSPLEYLTDNITSKVIILSTTNGTKAICGAREAEKVYIGAFLNAPTVSQAVLACNRDLYLICAGTQDHISLEDACCAGYFIDLIVSERPDFSYSKRAALALTLFQSYKSSLPYYLSYSKNGRALCSMGNYRDIEFCCLTDFYSISPVFNRQKGVIRLSGEP